MTKRDWLLRKAEEFDQKEVNEAEKMESGYGSDAMCSYYHRLAEHHRFLAVNADDVGQVDAKGNPVL
jgi:hypothetical protein